MAIIETHYRTFTCNGPNCTKTVTFEPSKAAEIMKEEANAWLNSFRVVQTADGRNFLYCSDTCEVEAATASTHNKPEPKKVVEMPAVGSAEFVRLAAQAAAAREQADKDLRKGPPTLS